MVGPAPLRTAIGTLAEGLSVVVAWLMRPFMPDWILWGCTERLAERSLGYLLIYLGLIR